MRSAVVWPVAVGLVVLLAPPALADPPGPALPSLPSALTADLTATERSDLAALTAGGGVRLGAVVRTPGGPAVVTLDAGSAGSARQAAALLDAQPSVDAAGLSRTVHVTGASAGLGTVNGQNAVYQWDLPKINAAGARSMVSGDLPTVTVAVLDTGIAANPQLTPYLVPGHNFSASDPGNPDDTADRHFHGTHVAGTIGASVQQAGIEGIAAGVRLLPVKVLADDGSGYSTDIASGIIWAADHGADVINMSLGGPGDDPTMQSAIDYARGKGVVVVAAVGNDAQTGNPVDYPGASSGVIGVAATDEDDVRAGFSEYGPQVDVAAPGVDIESLYLTSGTAAASGTSMATPHVAAIAALVKAVDPGFTPDQVETLIENATVDLGTPGRDYYYGTGRVDALAAVDAAFATAGTTPPTVPSQAPIDDLYQRLGGASGVLGAATSAEFQVAGGTERTYASGVILLAPGAPTAHYLTGQIAGRYAATAGPGGPLGWPTSDPFAPLRAGGAGQHFQGGSLYWSPSTGTHTVVGAIRDKWSSGGWETSKLGYPTTDAFGPLRGGGWGQHFQGGSIYWSPAGGTRIVTGSIRDTWAAQGWESGSLGYPTTEVFGPLRGGGWGQHFQGGSIYWSPAGGTRIVTGSIRDAWARTGWEAGSLGYSTSDVFGPLRGGGWGQHFQGGSIYWSPAGGTRIVTGSIRDSWAAQGWEGGSLGYPTSDAYAVWGGWAQNFQGGTLTWIQRTNGVTATYRR